MKTIPRFPNACCWDDVSRPQVMDTVALHVREAVFMATHFPCPIQRVSPESRKGEPYTEDQYLQDFLDPRLNHVFSVVYGDSGTGKSHLVRWLAQNLSGVLGDAARTVRAVLVPRESANLAAVLMRILEGCKGPVAGELRRKIAESRESLTVRGAMTQVLDALAFVLEPDNMSGSSLSFPLDEEHEFIVGLLPHLLRAQPVRTALLADQTDGVVSRIARHVSRERRDLRPDDEGVPSWRATDLEVLSSQPPSATGEDWKELCNSLVSDESLRATAAAVLNRALTEALPRLMGVRRGDLAEALREIRQMLAAEGKSLILLIEDLSVAQGVDEELIECLLPGELTKGLCTLRSVIGITNDDFERLQTNIAGRIDIAVSFSARVSRVEGPEDGFGETDLLDFASRYLNATRYSLDELEEWHGRAGPDAHLPSYCVEHHCPNLEACHSTFGAIGGRGLYPFNRHALLRLYQTCEEQDRTSTDRTVFKPRRLISRVLSRVLAAAERELPLGRFPSPTLRDEFGLRTLGASRQQELKDRYQTEVAGRLAAAWELFSDDPFAGSVSSELLAAYALPEDAGTRGAARGTDSETRRPAEAVRPAGDDARRHTGEPDEFDRWTNGHALANEDLNAWRSVLYKALSEYCDWDSEPSFTYLFKECFGQRCIDFAGQRTRTGGDIVLHVGRSPENAIAMRTLVRGESAGDWQGTARTLEFLEGRTAELRRAFEKELRKGGRHAGKRLAVHSLTHACLIAGRIEADSSPEGVWSALLADEPPASAVPLDPVQQQLVTELERASRQIREMCSCRKGMQTGGMVDAAAYMAEVRSAARTASSPTQGTDGVSSALYGGFAKLSQLLAVRAPDWTERQLRLAGDLVRLVEHEGQGGDIALFIAELRKSLLAAQRRLGLSAAAASLPDQLASLVVQDVVVRTARKALNPQTGTNDRLCALARLPADSIRALLDLCGKVASEFDRIEARIRASIGDAEEDPVDLEARVRQDLAELADTISNLAR